MLVKSRIKKQDRKYAIYEKKKIRRLFSFFEGENFRSELLITFKRRRTLGQFGAHIFRPA